MIKTENINELAAALSVFQGEVEDASKDKKAFNYFYADLATVLKVARPLLAKHKLAITQLVGGDSEGDNFKIQVMTVLLHASGQWIASEISINTKEGKGMTLAQGAGSNISYLRRYCVLAILGMAQEDNDAADQNVNHQVTIAQKEFKASGGKIPSTNTPSQDNRFAAELIKLVALTKTTPTTVQLWLSKAQVATMAELSESQCVACIDLLKKQLIKEEEANV